MEEKNFEARIFGYARVSSQEQNLDRQIMALKNYVPKEHILVDKASGKNLEREAYQALKGALGLRTGDTLYITSLDRLSRNKTEIKQELQWFKDSGIRLNILDLPTSLIEIPEGQGWILDMIQNILIEVLSSTAEQERLAIRKRQKEGLDAARAQGKHLGRPKLKVPENFEEVYTRWKAGAITARAAQRETGLSSASFYRLARGKESASKSHCNLTN